MNDGDMAVPNERLRAAMREAGVTVQDVATATDVDPKTVSRWLTQGRTPYPRHRSAVATYLGADEANLWPIVAVRRSVRVDLVEADPLHSPQNKSPSLQDSITWITETNTSDDAIEEILRAANYLAEAHVNVPAKKVLAEVLTLHQQTQALLLSGKQRLRQTRELLRINSNLLAHACLLLGDLEQDRTAAAHGNAALLFAQEAAANDAEAIAWSVRAKTARWQERYVESAELARQGFDVSALTPTKVELAYREANAIALFGDAVRARQALHRAEKTAEALPADHSDVSVWSFPVERQAVFTQSVAIRTGNPDSALRAVAMADAGWKTGDPQVPATWAQIRVGAGIAYLMKGALDAAVEQILPVLDLPPELRIGTVTGYLKSLHSLLRESPLADSGIAVELSQRIQEFNATTPAAKRAGERNESPSRAVD